MALLPLPKRSLRCFAFCFGPSGLVTGSKHFTLPKSRLGLSGSRNQRFGRFFFTNRKTCVFFFFVCFFGVCECFFFFVCFFFLYVFFVFCVFFFLCLCFFLYFFVCFLLLFFVFLCFFFVCVCFVVFQRSLLMFELVFFCFKRKEGPKENTKAESVFSFDQVFKEKRKDK